MSSAMMTRMLGLAVEPESCAKDDRPNAITKDVANSAIAANFLSRCIILPVRNLCWALLTVFHRLDDFVGRPHRMREKSIVDERRRITIAPFGMLGPRSRVFRYCYFESLFQQFAQVRFDAHVGEHAAKNDLADLALAKL